MAGWFFCFTWCQLRPRDSWKVQNGLTHMTRSWHWPWAGSSAGAASQESWSSSMHLSTWLLVLPRSMAVRGIPRGENRSQRHGNYPESSPSNPIYPTRCEGQTQGFRQKASTSRRTPHRKAWEIRDSFTATLEIQCPKNELPQCSIHWRASTKLVSFVHSFYI